MRTTPRLIAIVATLAAAALVAGCSRASDDVNSVLWNQVDEAERVVYDVLTASSSDAPTFADLHDRLINAAVGWDGEADVAFSEIVGTPVVYNYQGLGEINDASFDLFVTSGVDEHVSLPGWLDSRPRRVYTCYRIEVSFLMLVLYDFRRTHDYGDDALACPPELVNALGDGAQYREPAAFDG